MKVGQRERAYWKFMMQTLGNPDGNFNIKLWNGSCETSDKEEIEKLLEKFWREIVWKNPCERNASSTHICTPDDGDLLMFDKITFKNKCNTIKNNKSVGVDNVPGEFIKYGGEHLHRLIYDIFKNMWDEAWVPDTWRESEALLIHKGGRKAKTEINNYRPIANISSLCKLFGACVNEELNLWLEREECFGREQTGFRKNHNCSENIYIIRELVEQSRSTIAKKKLFLGFLDIWKAFDRVDRPFLLQRLNDIGMGEKGTNVIEALYTNNKVKFKLPGGIKTEYLENNVGVRQGCTISPTLFNIFIEELLHRLRSSNFGATLRDGKVTTIGYADDIVLIADSEIGLQEF